MKNFIANLSDTSVYKRKKFARKNCRTNGQFKTISEKILLGKIIIDQITVCDGSMCQILSSSSIVERLADLF